MLISSTMTSKYIMEKPRELTTVARDDLSSMKRKTFNRRVIYIAIGTLVFLVVAGAVILAVYFGVIISRKNDDYKEYKASTYADDGSSVKQTVIVTNSEEKFMQENVKVVADFETGLMVFKLISSESALKSCLVTSFNVTDFQKPDEIKSAYTEDEIIVNSGRTERRSFEVTDIWLNNKALGTLQREMCDGTLTYFIREIKEFQGRQRRAVHEITINLIFFKWKITFRTGVDRAPRQDIEQYD